MPARPRKRSSVATPKKFRAAATSSCSTTCLPTTSSTTRHSRGPPPTRRESACSTPPLRQAFPDFRAEIGWQSVDGDLVTTYKVYYGTHLGTFLGVAPTGREIHFETVDAMRVRDGKITDHWGVANLLSAMMQLDALPPLGYGATRQQS
jgi:hypothetical protein